MMNRSRCSFHRSKLCEERFYIVSLHDRLPKIRRERVKRSFAHRKATDVYICSHYICPHFLFFVVVSFSRCRRGNLCRFKFGFQIPDLEAEIGRAHA